MAYTKDGYTLYSRNVELKGGRTQTIYFFSKGMPKSGSPVDLPPGFEVSSLARTGLPILRRIGGSKWREMRAAQKARAVERREARATARQTKIAERKARIAARREAAAERVAAKKAAIAAKRAAVKAKKAKKTKKPVKKHKGKAKKVVKAKKKGRKTKK
ncbi:MAG: hypothetical protein ACYDCK_12015 [Thermoplasmatota archaeon]